MKPSESLRSLNKFFVFFILLSTLLADNHYREREISATPIRGSFSYLSEGKTTYVRPSNLDKTYISENGLFKFHYTFSGHDSIDSTCTNTKGIPDWIYEAEIAINKAHHILIDSLGFDPPPSDGDEYDIFFVNYANGTFGETMNEERVTSTNRPNDYISFMQIENDFDGYRTSGIGALQITMVHEYFHAVQLGYNLDYNSYLPNLASGDVFFFEWSSVWFEMYCYPDVHDFYNYADYLLSHLDSQIWNSNFKYPLGIFMNYLIDNYSIDILIKTWNKIKNNQKAFYALQETVKDETNFTLAEIYNQFCQQLYFTGKNYNTQYAISEESQNFSELNINWGNRYEFSHSLIIEENLAQFSTYPMEITFNTARDLGILIDANFSQNFIGSYILKKSTRFQIGKLDLTSDQFIGHADIGDTLLLFITNKDLNDYQYLKLRLGYVEPIKQFILSNIFPNPIDGNGKLNFKITTNYIDDIDLELFNLLGQKILNKSYIFQNNELYSLDLRMDVSEQLPSGIYFLKIKSGNIEKVKKFTIIK